MMKPYTIEIKGPPGYDLRRIERVIRYVIDGPEWDALIPPVTVTCSELMTLQEFNVRENAKRADQIALEVR